MDDDQFAKHAARLVKFSIEKHKDGDETEEIFKKKVLL